MRWPVLAGLMLTVVAVVQSTAIGSELVRGAGSSTTERAETASPSSVDLQLIIAVDISYSMDPDELAIQREGYAQAIISPEFLQALKQLRFGKVALTYFEWSSRNDQTIVIPWRVVDGPETAGSVSDEIMHAPIRRGSRTSISGAVAFALSLYESSGVRGVRRVLDISGDGPNNDGSPITDLRAAALEKGITINGLPVMVKESMIASTDIENLDWYYEDCVIGGPGAFVVPIKGRDQFKEAIRAKLVLEVAGLVPDVRFLRAATREPRISCTIGEQLWQQRWGR
jgi:Protein of unknown function (DUF1194)